MIVDREVARAIRECHAQLLAPELLTMIFHEVMALHERKPILLLPPTHKHPENELDTKPLLALSHVCRYWRDVAIATPALWTRLHGRHRDQMDAFLERSQPLTVTLFLDDEHQGGVQGGPLLECVASVVRAHSQRLRRLDLSMIPIWNHIVPLLKSLQAPQIECLTIMSPDLCEPELSRSALSWTPLLDGEASSLRALGILSVTDWLPCSIFPNLTHLVLYFCGEMQELFHPFDLLRLLYNTPALEFLHVDLLVYEEPYLGTWQLPSDPVPLPLLRSLVFTDCPYKLLILVLPCLSLPEDVFIRLQDILNYIPVQGPPDAFPPLPIRPVTSLDVVMQGQELFMVADGPTSGLWLSAMHDLNGVPEPQDWEDWLLSLHECLTLTHVTHLHIWVESRETMWPAFLSYLPQLTHLTALFEEYGDEPDTDIGIFDCPTAVLCTALAPTRDPGTEVPCPVLDTLTIEWPHEVTEEDFSSLPCILDMLRFRSSTGYPIRRVIVQVPLGLTFQQVPDPNFFELHKLIGARCPSGTEYEVVEKPEAGKGMCAFEMREVWKVDGADRYWEVGDREKPHYDMVMSQMFGE